MGQLTKQELYSMGNQRHWKEVVLFSSFFFATEYRKTSISTNFHYKNFIVKIYFHLLSVYRVPGTAFRALCIYHTSFNSHSDPIIIVLVFPIYR